MADATSDVRSLALSGPSKSLAGAIAPTCQVRWPSIRKRARRGDEPLAALHERRPVGDVVVEERADERVGDVLARDDLARRALPRGRDDVERRVGEHRRLAAAVFGVEEDDRVRAQVQRSDELREHLEIEVDRDDAAERPVLAVNRLGARDPRDTLIVKDVRRRPDPLLLLLGERVERARARVVVRVVFVAKEPESPAGLDDVLEELGLAADQVAAVGAQLVALAVRADEGAARVAEAHPREARVRTQHGRELERERFVGRDVVGQGAIAEQRRDEVDRGDRECEVRPRLLGGLRADLIEQLRGEGVDRALRREVRVDADDRARHEDQDRDRDDEADAVADPSRTRAHGVGA